MKNCVIAAAAILSLVTSAAAEAQTARRAPMPKVYFGMAYQGMAVARGTAGATLPKNLSDGFNGHLGYRMGRLGVEVGYSQSTASSYVGTPAYQTEFSVTGPTIDLNYYLPIGGPQLSLVGSVGGSYLTGKGQSLHQTAPFTISKSELGGRAGAGLQIRPIPSFSIDLMGRYQTAKFNGLAKSAIVGTLGFNFYF